MFILRGAGGGGQGSVQRWTAWLLSQPFGRWLLGVVAVLVLAVGLTQFYLAWSAQFRETLELRRMNQTRETWTVRLGRIGFAARGVVFCIPGALLVVAAVQMDASDARGLDGALEALDQQTYAPWLFGLVAGGLAVYGFFKFLVARYRRMVRA